MNKYLLLSLLVTFAVRSEAQILGNLDSVNPNTAMQGQTLTTTITEQTGSYMLGSPPCDNYGIFLLQGTDTIFSNYYNWQWMDVVDVEFSIPPAANPGFYDVYVASAHYDWWWGTCTTIGYWVLYSGFEVTLDTHVGQESSGQISAVVYPDPVNKIGCLVFSNNDHKKYRFNIMDAYGRIVYTEEITESKAQLNLSGLDAGIYYYSLTGIENRSAYTGKFVVTE